MILNKMHGAGNDFIVIDAITQDVKLTRHQIAHLCDRRFGIGADGLMLMLPPTDEMSHFDMRYYNSDGGEASMCGNGARCIAMFYYICCLDVCGEAGKYILFTAKDGHHVAQILRYNPDTRQGRVIVTMRDVPQKSMRSVLDGWYLNTGVPHYVQAVTDLEHFDVVGEGRRLRHHPDLGAQGANVDFVEKDDKGVLHIRTYERGVEDETLACGTGITAAAIAMDCHKVKARGGDFRVDFDTPDKRHNAYTFIGLTGPVAYVFQTEISL